MHDCSVASDSATPWTVAYQVPLFMEFFRQEHGSRLPFPSPGDLSIPGIEPASLALAGGFFTTCSGLPRWHSYKESTCQGRRHRRLRFSLWGEKISELRRYPGVGNDNLLQILAWKIYRLRSLAGYSPWGCKELDESEHNDNKVKTGLEIFIKMIFKRSSFIAPSKWTLSWEVSLLE